MPEPPWFEPHQPLDAVWRHALSAGLEPIADDSPTQLGGLPYGMTSSVGGSHPSPPHFRLEAVDHYTAALAEGFAGAPQIVSPDAIENSVNAVACKAMNLFHEVRGLVVDRDATEFPDDRGPLRRTGSVHLDAGQLR